MIETRLNQKTPYIAEENIEKLKEMYHDERSFSERHKNSIRFTIQKC